jgi:translation initiation factor IF-3
MRTIPSWRACWISNACSSIGSSSLFPHNRQNPPVLLPSRNFGGRTQDRAKQPGEIYLSNEKLISKLVSKKRTTADGIEVRLVTAEEERARIATLSEAIEIALEKELDLIGVSVDQDIPVVRIDQLSGFVYKQSKGSKKKQKKRSEKEFQFSGSIADHDLERKTKKMIETLDMGLQCRVTVSCRPHVVQKDPHACVNMANKVLDRVSDAGEINGRITYDAGRTLALFVVTRFSKNSAKGRGCT